MSCRWARHCLEACLVPGSISRGLCPILAGDAIRGWLCQQGPGFLRTQLATPASHLVAFQSTPTLPMEPWEALLGAQLGCDWKDPRNGFLSSVSPRTENGPVLKPHGALAFTSALSAAFQAGRWPIRLLWRRGR